MLAYILAIVVGLGSLAIYIAAFFFPEVHRKSDFLWSGLGLFYALILWTCAGRITGAVLLGQMASVALIGWFGWQTLSLRREVTPATEQTKIPSKDSTSKSLKFPAKDKAELTTKLQESQAETVESHQEKIGAESITQSPEAETPTPRESETIETLTNLTETSETEIKSEWETPGVGETTSQEWEVKQELDKVETKTKDLSEKKEKTGVVSTFLTPVNSWVNNLKNVFAKKDKDKTKVETLSKSVAAPEIKADSDKSDTTETDTEMSVAETEIPETTTLMETEVKETEDEGLPDVEIRQTEEAIETDGEEEEVTVMEKDVNLELEKTSQEETPLEEVEEKVSEEVESQDKSQKDSEKGL